VVALAAAALLLRLGVGDFVATGLCCYPQPDASSPTAVATSVPRSLFIASIMGKFLS